MEASKTGIGQSEEDPGETPISLFGSHLQLTNALTSTPPGSLRGFSIGVRPFCELFDALWYEPLLNVMRLRITQWLPKASVVGKEDSSGPVFRVWVQHSSKNQVVSFPLGATRDPAEQFHSFTTRDTPRWWFSVHPRKGARPRLGSRPCVRSPDRFRFRISVTTPWSTHGTGQDNSALDDPFLQTGGFWGSVIRSVEYIYNQDVLKPSRKILNI